MKLAKTCFIAAALCGAALSAMAGEPAVMLEMKIERDGSELAKPCISAFSGEKGVYKKVTECIYPTDFDLQQATGTNGVCSWAVEPQSFTMREVGVIVDVDPTVVDGMVDLHLRVEIVDEPTWKNFGYTKTDSDGTKRELSMEQPFFKVQSMDNRFLLQPGVSTTINSDFVITITPRIVDAAKIAADTSSGVSDGIATAPTKGTQK